MEIQRKLATVRRIESIDSIEGADNIVVASVDGWKVVVKKGEFKAGDLAVYFEIDSLLPMEPEFEFLKASCYRKTAEQEGYKLRTIKLRGQVSSGLLIPIDIAHIILLRKIPNLIGELDEGMDITEFLGVEKWIENIPVELSGDVVGKFPSFVPKTDEERVQNLKKEFYQWRNEHMFSVSEKLDGTSFTCFISPDWNEFGVCSRNWQLKETEGNLQWTMARKLQLEEKLREEDRPLALQGELIGPGIQQNRYKLKEHQIRFFTGYYVDTGERLNPEELSILLGELNLMPVPHLGDLVFTDRTEVDDLLKFAEGRSQLADTEREGIVVRSTTDSTISFKVISNKFLAKKKD